MTENKGININNQKIGGGTHYFLIIQIAVVVVCGIIYMNEGRNAWAEIVAEYMSYAAGASLTGSFAGYITLFPIIIVKLWYYVFKYFGIPYIQYTCFVAWVFASLCISCIMKILLNEAKNIRYILFIMMPIFALIFHPSVASLINITHLGYLPMILYILVCAGQEDFRDKMAKVPKMVLGLMVVSAMSKPSLIFILLAVVLVLTKLYKNKLAFLITLLVIIIVFIQSVLYSTAAGGLKLYSIAGMGRFVITFIQSVGGSTLFSFVNYKEKISLWHQIVSFMVGCFILSTIVLKFFRKRTINNLISCITLGIMLAVANIPFLMIDYENGLCKAMNANLVLCLSKYKMQYQLTSSVVCTAMLIYCIEYFETFIFHKTKWVLSYWIQVRSVVLLILLFNGLMCGIYHGNDITVKGIQLDSYDRINSVYMYSPYPDWDYSYSDSAMGGWIKGNRITKYLNKPEMLGSKFLNKNTEWDNVQIENESQAHIYLMLSDEYNKKVPCWFSMFINDKKSVVIDEKIEVVFSDVSENGIRYAVIPYTKNNVELLKRDDFNISVENTVISSDRLNCIIVW